MRAPTFWWRETPTLAALALSPAGALYGAITARRMMRPGQPAGVPVLCVGNLVAGGAGKTPATIALARLLRAEGRSPAILSRGYGRRRADSADAVLRVELDHHGAAETGDEPLLLAHAAPTYVCTDRRRAAAVAVAAGADSLILDDGLQNPTLRKTWTLAVADGATGIGNKLCVPAGPLRAPLDHQWPAVTMLAVIGGGERGQQLARMAAARGIMTLEAHLVADAATVARWRGRRLFAFAGIGRPEKFFDTLRAAGLDLVGTRSFPDHHVFSPGDRAQLQTEASRSGAMLVTTAKDRVRLPPDFSAEALPVTLVFDAPARLSAAIRLSLG